MRETHAECVRLGMSAPVSHMAWGQLDEWNNIIKLTSA